MRRHEKAGAQRAVHQLHEAGGGQHRQGKGLQDGGDEHGPDRHRQAEHRHAGGAHLDDRGQVVDRTHHRRDADERQPDEPQRLAVFIGQRERGIGRPARFGGTAGHKKAAADGDEGGPHEPVAEHVQRRKGHVVGADHQRDQKVAERTGQNRNDHEEDHHRGVHGEQDGVELGRDLPPFGREQQIADAPASATRARPPASGRRGPAARRSKTRAGWKTGTGCRSPCGLWKRRRC